MCQCPPMCKPCKLHSHLQALFTKKLHRAMSDCGDSVQVEVAPVKGGPITTAYHFQLTPSFRFNRLLTIAKSRKVFRSFFAQGWITISDKKTGHISTFCHYSSQCRGVVTGQHLHADFPSPTQVRSARRCARCLSWRCPCLGGRRNSWSRL